MKGEMIFDRNQTHAAKKLLTKSYFWRAAAQIYPNAEELAEVMKHYYIDDAPRYKEDIYNKLLFQALACVDWQEIAEDVLNRPIDEIEKIRQDFLDYCKHEHIRVKDIAAALCLTEQETTAKLHGEDDFTATEIRTLCIIYNLEAEQFI